MTTSQIEAVFSKIYAEDSWGRGSGPGSNPDVLADYRAFLERIVRLNNIRTVVDVGCGDWQFSRFVNFGQAQYLGLDLVDSVVAANNAAYGSDRVEFKRAPADPNEIPSGDLIIMKDVLQHLPDEQIMVYREIIRSKFRYALITNSRRKGDDPVNIDIQPGEFRCLALNAEPYNFGGIAVVEQVYPVGPVYEHLETLLLINRS